MPKFSILIPVIKGRFLSYAIKSVIRQTFSDWELVIYDDCSPDNIASIVDEYKDDRVFFLRGEKNLGDEDPSIVWNKLLGLAKGEYVCLLGDDDIIADNFLEEINNLILKYSCNCVFRAKLRRIDEHGTLIFEGSDLPELETWDQALYERNVNKRVQSTSEFVLERNSLEKIGGYVNFPRACGSDDATYLLLSRDKGIVSTNNTFACWRKSSLNISDNDSYEMNEYKIRFLLEWELRFLDNIFSANVPLSKLYDSIYEFSYLKNIRLAEESFKKKDDFIRKELYAAKKELDLAKKELDIKDKNLKAEKRKLVMIYNSREWRLVSRVRIMFKMLFPVGSLRRSCLAAVFGIARLFGRISMILLRKVKSSFFLTIIKLHELKKAKKRKINLGSKKLVYVGHSYHNKTMSTAFLIDYLKEFFDVEVILDESWKGKPPLDLSFIDDSYLGVVFFQNLPRWDILKNIKNDNLILFPMYDSVVDMKFSSWIEYRNFKIINFSKTLHKKLSRWGFESTCVQYFPNPQEFSSGNLGKVFFWQRISKINFNVIVELFRGGKLDMHIHKVVDPNQEFIKPSKEDEKKFNITYSDWFDTREEMWEMIKQMGVYIAPREFEGIGQSFLEAMAMGKAVVAVNNPTMNEYIEHGKTGYLFDLKNPKKIDLSNIEEVQKNTYDYMKAGYEKWESEKHRIIDFIEKE